MIRLTIAIPTYNRPDSLAATVTRLLPQLTPEVEIIVLDNCSDVPASQTLAPLLEHHPSAQVRVICNATNIGGSGNILRCLEVGSGEWIWTLSDDDAPTSTSVCNVLEGTREHAEATCINFCTSILPHRVSLQTISLEKFLDKAESFGNLLFITANVYNRNRAHRHLAPAIAYANSCASQVVFFLAALCEGEAVALSGRYIADFVPPASEQGWPVYFFFNFYDIIDALPDFRSQRKLAMLINGNVIDQSISSYLRWAFRSSLSYPKSPSPLLFLARGARTRLLYATGFKARSKWTVLATLTSLAHRHHDLCISIWKAMHSFKYGKELVQSAPIRHAFHGHFLSRNKPQ